MFALRQVSKLRGMVAPASMPAMSEVGPISKSVCPNVHQKM